MHVLLDEHMPGCLKREVIGGKTDARTSPAEPRV